MLSASLQSPPNATVLPAIRPPQSELIASLPSADKTSKKNASDSIKTQSVRTATLILPRAKNTRDNLDRLVSELKSALGAQNLRTVSADKASDAAGDVIIDARKLSSAQKLAKFGLPDSKLESWSISRAAQSNVITLSSKGIWGTHNAVNRLLEIAGVRAWSYHHTARPEAGKGLLVPAADNALSGKGSDRFAYRGMAPHTYHPIELSQALHDPSPKAAETLRRYIDWCVSTGQNVIHFPLLDVEADNVAIKLRKHPERVAAWEAHVRDMNAYAKKRGVQVAANVSFTVFTPAHLVAMHFLEATVDTARLNRSQKAWQKLDPASAPAKQARAKYERLLDQVMERHGRRIDPLVQRMIALGFQELHFNLGTSEFTSPNDDLQIRWLERAEQTAKQIDANVRITAGSHVPAEPVSPTHGIPMFDLHEKADKRIGAHIHTVQIPALTDRADTYGVPSFRHKIRTLGAATKDRLETWYPETSYWVQYDSTIPLYLPVYMLARHRDHRRVLSNDRIDGQLTFTTAWEWGYWLNDAAMARMTTNPNDDLTTILLDVLKPLGKARNATVDLLRDVMISQQRFLVDDGLIRHVQGFDFLSSLGEKAGKVPGLNKLIHATSNVPKRTGWEQIKRMNPAELARFERDEITKLADLLGQQLKHAKRARDLTAKAPGNATARKAIEEMRDGLEINALRTKQVLSALRGLVAARKSKLGSPVSVSDLQAAQAAARQAMQGAELVIRKRESAYQKPAQDAYDGHRLSNGAVGTMWGKRSLTPVHELKYWKATQKELEDAIQDLL